MSCPCSEMQAAVPSEELTATNPGLVECDASFGRLLRCPVCGQHWQLGESRRSQPLAVKVACPSTWKASDSTPVRQALLDRARLTAESHHGP